MGWCRVDIILRPSIFLRYGLFPTCRFSATCTGGGEQTQGIYAIRDLLRIFMSFNLRTVTIYGYLQLRIYEYLRPRILRTNSSTNLRNIRYILRS